MDIKYHIETAWRLCINNIVPLIILTLVTAALSVVSLGILAPALLAGYTYALLLLVTHNREPKAQDAFSQMRLFFPLLIFAVIILLIVTIGFALLVIPGIIVALVVSYTCIYMLPIMVDRQYGLMDAVKASTAMVTRPPVVDHVIVFIIFSALITIGGSSFFGFILLQPFATLFLLSVYKETR